MSLLRLPNEDELDAIEGWLAPAEGQRLAYLASIVPKELAIVELGTWKGRSTAWLGLGSRYGRGARVFAIDHWKGSPEQQGLFPHQDCSTYPDFRANMDWLELWDIVNPITGSTLDVAKTWDKDIGLLFIDADHEYESVRGDFLAWSPFVVVGGWVALHDIASPGPNAVAGEFIRDSGAWGDFNPYLPFNAKKLRER